MAALTTQMQMDEVIDLSKKDYFFPKVFLESQRFEFKKDSWDNGRPFYSQDLDSGYTVHVVDFEEVWLERHGKLTQVSGVKTCMDLLELERLLA